MHKNRVYFLLLVFCFLNNNLSASADDPTSRAYDQKKTEKLTRATENLIRFCYHEQESRQSLSHVLKKKLRINKYYAHQIQSLIEQGAELKKLQFYCHQSPLATAVYLPDPRLTQLCLQAGDDPNLPNSFIYTTPLHTVCNLSNHTNAQLLEKTALLRFFGAHVLIEDEQFKRPRDLLAANNPTILYDFAATLVATEIIKDLKKPATNKARSQLLRPHLPENLIDIVNAFGDDAAWDNACLPAIQEQVARITNKPIPMPRKRWDFIIRKRR